VVPAGFKPKPINTESQLLSLVQKFPDEAAKAGLTVDEIKEHAMRHGGEMVELHAHGGFHNPIDTLGMHPELLHKHHPVFHQEKNRVF